MAAGQGCEFGLEDRLVGGLQRGIAVEELDDIIALIHTVLDQRIARQRPHHIDPRLGGFELRREHRKGLAIGAGEGDAAALDKGARRIGTHARDDAIAGDRLLPVARVEQQLALAHFGGRGLGADGDAASGGGLVEQLDIGGFGAGKIGPAIEDGDHIALRGIGGQPQRVFNARIARANHGDVFVDIFAGVIQLILHLRHIRARATQQIGIALRANRQNHRIGGNALAAFQRQGKIPRLAGDGDNLGLVAHGNLRGSHLLVPSAKDRLALARIEGDIRTQHQRAGARHHMLALLIFEDRVAEVIGALDQHVR